jgi:hypothetical protein
MLKTNLAILLCAYIVSSSCNTNNNNAEQSATVTEPVVTINTVDDKIQKESALKQFNALEKLFDNQNYQLVENKDTSYIYFSRVNKYILHTYQYKMIHGDSAQLKIDTIQLNAQNKVIWKWKDTLVEFTNATDFAAKFASATSKNFTIQLNRQSNNTLLLKEGNSEPIQLRQTITLSDFLIKSYYDFQHGTKLANGK